MQRTVSEPKAIRLFDKKSAANSWPAGCSAAVSCTVTPPASVLTVSLEVLRNRAGSSKLCHLARHMLHGFLNLAVRHICSSLHRNLGDFCGSRFNPFNKSLTRRYIFQDGLGRRTVNISALYSLPGFIRYLAHFLVIINEPVFNFARIRIPVDNSVVQRFSGRD